MRISGRKIARRMEERIRDELQELEVSPQVALLQVGSHPAIDSFVRIKQKVAERVGITLVHHQLAHDVTTQDVLDEIGLLIRTELAGGVKKYDGLVVQLPLAPHIDEEVVLSAVPRVLDIDVLSATAQEHMYEDGVFPPVVGAIRAILREVRVDLRKSSVAVIGEGKLVGGPVIAWLRAQGVDPEVVTATAGDVAEAVGRNHVVVSGVGKPGLITPDMVGATHILIDAGTSESGGVVVGDIDPACYEICKAYTPVPGGVGPITVSVLFSNLVSRLQSRHDDVVE